MTPLNIQEICDIVKGRRSGLAVSDRVTGCVIDGRIARPGDLFFAIGGERTHGIRHASQAIGNGALAVVVDWSIGR